MTAFGRSTQRIMTAFMSDQCITFYLIMPIMPGTRIDKVMSSVLLLYHLVLMLIVNIFKNVKLLGGKKPHKLIHNENCDKTFSILKYQWFLCKF